MVRQAGRGEDQASQGGKQSPEVDYVEAEHDPAASRRASDAGIQRMLGARIQRKANGAAGPSIDAGGVQHAASESGAPLPANVRGRFESSLGTDLSGVRVHTGSASAGAADGLGAKAYTTGQDIHFATGEYDPASKDGQQLLAHEVAHTVQQGHSSATQPQAKLAVSEPGDNHEREADQAADAMIAGLPASVASGSADAQANTVQRKEKDGAAPAASAASRVQQQIELLSGHAELIAARLTNHKSAIDRREVNALRFSLEAERELLMKSVGQLPSGSPLIEKANTASGRALQVMQRLTDFANAKDAHNAVERDFGSTDGVDHYKNAREQNDGFCDRAPQETPPCDLDEPERERRRGQVRAAVHQLASNWRQAITSKYLEEMFKKKQISFEEQLGQILFNVLFGVLGSGVKALVGKGIDKAAKGRIEYHGEVQIGGPTSKDIELHKKIADKVVDEASAIGKQKLTGSITAQQLEAKAAQSVTIPTDRAAFLTSLEDVPAAWETNINQHLLKDLFDDDLVMLADVLPQKAAAMLPGTFKNLIEAQLRRFEEQVLAVNTAPISDTRPIQVITGRGPVRWALVRPEMKPDKSLRGEWKNSPTRTGKWTFVRWIDDDMKDMAVERAIQGPFGHGDATAGARMQTSTDTSFWDQDSLHALAKDTNAPGHKPVGDP